MLCYDTNLFHGIISWTHFLFKEVQLVACLDSTLFFFNKYGCKCSASKMAQGSSRFMKGFKCFLTECVGRVDEVHLGGFQLPAGLIDERQERTLGTWEVGSHLGNRLFQTKFQIKCSPWFCKSLCQSYNMQKDKFPKFSRLNVVQT